MAETGGELEPLAAAALQEHDLDPHKASDAVAMVRAVMKSDLWKRARAGTPCLAEVPIEFLQPEAGDVVDTIVDITQAERGILMLKDDDGLLTPRVARDKKKRDIEPKDFSWKAIGRKGITDIEVTIRAKGQAE